MGGGLTAGELVERLQADIAGGFIDADSRVIVSCGDWLPMDETEDFTANYVTAPDNGRIWPGRPDKQAAFICCVKRTPNLVFIDDRGRFDEYYGTSVDTVKTVGGEIPGGGKLELEIAKSKVRALEGWIKRTEEEEDMR